jgi:pimeloyl-ACP methyl ester carboxylesterase
MRCRSRRIRAHTYYFPTDLGPGGIDHPVVLWGNGTFLNPTHYDALLRHFASHGFIVAAANTSNAGSGQEMLGGLDNLTTFNSQSGNRFFDHVDLTRVATIGHSQGGGGAIEAARDPRVDTAVPIEPWRGTESGLHGPTFFLAGENDTTIPPATVRQKYMASSGIPAAYGELAGGDHLHPLVDGSGFRAPATAWLRWQLMGDSIARSQFIGDCSYCTSSIWSDYEANALLNASTN